MFERFTERARRVVVLAQDEAKDLNHNYIGTEHVLLGLIREGEGNASRALVRLGLTLDDVREQIIDIIGQGQQRPVGHIPFTPRCKKVLELALREALQLGHNYIGTEHILLGIIREGSRSDNSPGVAIQILVKLGVDPNRARQAVIQEIMETSSLYGSADRRDTVYGIYEVKAEPTPEEKDVQVVKLDAVVFERFDPKGSSKSLRKLIKRYNAALDDLVAVAADIRRLRGAESR